MKKPSFISFFSGIEGFRLGLEAAGWRCVHSVEIEPFCHSVQKARYGHPPETSDINKVRPRDLPFADMYVAGWPCQGLSVAGLRKGLADDRSGLFWRFVRLLEQKQPQGFLAENVPGLLTTCSCPRCGFQCKDCGAPAGAEDEGCQLCGSENLGGSVLPAHRGTDFFVVLTALQRIGYGVQARILDAQYLGVPQRRRRIFFVGHLGAPSTPEVLFESEGSGWNSQARREKRKIAAGELARSLGAVGGGNDPGANKGTLVRPRVASSVAASAGHHGHSSPRGDGSDNLVAATLGTNHKPDRGQKNENIIAGTLQSCSGDQGRKTPEVDHLVAPSIHTHDRKHPDALVATTSEKAHTLSKGTGGGLGGRDGQDDYVLVEGDSAASTPKLPRLRAGCGRGGEVSILRMNHTLSDPLVKGKVTDSISTGTAHGGYSNQAVARHEAPAVAAPLTAGSNPNSHAAGRRREDDQNIVVSGTIRAGDKQGQDAPVTVSPCLDTTFNRTGRGRTEAERLVTQPKTVAPCVTPIFERHGGDTEAKRLIQQPLFIHTADSGANQGQVKTNGKVDCLSKAQPGAVAFNAQAGGKQNRLNISAKGTDAISCKQTPAVAYNVKGMAHGGEKHAYETDTSGTVDRDGSRPSGNEAGTLIGPTPMSVRRLTPTECERLQGFADGHTCLCDVGRAANEIVRVVWETLEAEGLSEAIQDRRAAQGDAIGLATEALLQLDLRQEIQGFRGGVHDAVWQEACATTLSHVREGLRRLRGWTGDAKAGPGSQGRKHAEQSKVEHRPAVRELPHEKALEGRPVQEQEATGGGERPAEWTFCRIGSSRVPPWLDFGTFKLGGCGHSACGCECADSPRYKALGNAVATCAVEWIGHRLLVARGQ